jgi:hypothetical protein
MPKVSGVRLGGPARDGMGPTPVKTRFLPWGALLLFFVS